ncbi:matrixin family metalloprotease [Priestia megaterium]|uniref:matrixin family metalloprotease n=1 Tax=Priestia megaterium TaxID=1404 RepID=UPI001BE6A1E4|nr:matrixin family metalloprotease [Priestia megaterium]MBT2253832.1 hypothetical protein [Priestia megaterium]
MIISKELRWETGKTLKVRFLNGEKEVQDKVQKYAREWENYANIKFDFGNFTDAEIRIGFEKGRSVSSVGKSCLDKKYENKATLNFGWFDATTSEDEYSRVVLHEFGHVLGLRHEHQSPVANIPWDRGKAYKYFKDVEGFTKDQVDDNVLQVYNASENNYSQFDKNSIMCYSIPEEITAGEFSTPQNTTLSVMDKIFANIYYPKTRNVIALRGKNGKYVSADNALICNRDSIGEWETFELIDLGNNEIALKAYNGKYLMAEKGGWIRAHVTPSSDNIGDWEIYRFTVPAPGKIRLMSNKRCYLKIVDYDDFFSRIVKGMVLACHHEILSGPLQDDSIFTIKKL